MSDFGEHKAQARSNIDFIEMVKSSNKFHDWLITGCFYTAVHISEAIINRTDTVHYIDEDKNKKSVAGRISHSDELARLLVKDPAITPKISPHLCRKTIIRCTHTAFGGCFSSAYRTLEELSHLARYKCYTDCEKNAKTSLEKLCILIKHFNKNYCTVGEDESLLPEITNQK